MSAQGVPKNLKSVLLSLSLLALTASPAFGQGAAISYKGQLTASGSLASGPYDMQFTLFDTAAVGTGVRYGEMKTLSAVPVANGLFTVTLDFGGAVFDGSPRFLEIAVSKGGSAYSTLAPRQQVASVPYAIQSINAATAATAATALDVASGSVVKSLNNLKDNVTLAAGPNVTITPNGNTLTIASTGGGGGGSSLWSLAGANAYYNAGNVGIGTSTPANKLTVRTPTLGYGIEHTDGDIRLSTFVGRAKGYLGTLSNHKLTFFANDNGLPNMTMTLDTAGAVGIGTDRPTAGIRLEVIGATLLKPANGNIQFGSPNAELGMSIIPTNGNRADLRLSGSILKLVAGPGPGPPPPENGIAISTEGNVGIGQANPNSKLDVRSDASTAIIGKSTASSGVGVYGESAQFNAVRGVAHNANHGAVAGVHDGGGIAVYGTGATGVQGDGTSVGVYGRSASGVAVHAEGNATQTRDKGGFVKAMAYIDPFLPADQYVVRCYNAHPPQNAPATSTRPCGITVTRSPESGLYLIDFGFNIDDRFISLTARANYPSGSVPVVTGMVWQASGSQVYVIFRKGEERVDTRFYILVY